MAKDTVLVVEDDPALNEMLRFVLDRNGFEPFSGRRNNC